jgi:GT2 family glycosyltransferase
MFYLPSIQAVFATVEGALISTKPDFGDYESRMNSPLVSVVIPAYNQAGFLAEAIQSVLIQTYRNFEIVVVNDCSPDNTEEVVGRFSDPRLRYVANKKNLGLSATRNAGIYASQGDIIALLDSDDLFHAEKLQRHVAFLSLHSDIAVSYNSRFELNHSSDTIREIWRAPGSVGLCDLLLGFPFSPSDMVIRRDWALRVGLFDPEMGSAEDTDFPCRLALEGCRFGAIDRALNYRRHHSGRQRRNLPGRLSDVQRAQEKVFADPRCPAEIRAMGRMAIKHHLMVIVALAFLQRETLLGQKCLRELAELDPSILVNAPCELVTFLLRECIADESLDHERVIGSVFSQIPREFQWLSPQIDWAVARGWLWRGIRAVIWGRLEAGYACLSRAAQLRAPVDDDLIKLTTYHLLGYGNEFGEEAAIQAIRNLGPSLDRVASRGGCKVEASYLLNLAFGYYRAGDHRQALRRVIRALARDPGNVCNRGVLSILLRSAWVSSGFMPARQGTAGVDAKDATDAQNRRS